MSNNTLRAAVANVKLAAFDVDGIMTDGSLYFLNDGSEIKSFNTLDGLGLKMLQQQGVETAIITGRSSSQVERRAKSLGVSYLYQGRDDKLVALEELCSTHNYSLSQVAYIGDDLPDLAAIKAAAFGATVPNGHPLVIGQADWCTSRQGGSGAAREFCEAILDAKGLLQQSYTEFE
ncbi:MAG: KdsC family phosphatase [Pseudomonadales bacterium]